MHIHGFCSKLSNQIYCSLLHSIHDLGLFDLDIKGVFAFLDQTTMSMMNIHVSICNLIIHVLRCNFCLIFIFQYVNNCISGVMVSVLVSWFEPQSGQTKDYKIGICCFSAKHTALRRNKSKVWLAQNQNNLSDWSDRSVHGLLFQ